MGTAIVLVEENIYGLFSRKINAIKNTVPRSNLALR
jgi:hypothetical protein